MPNVDAVLLNGGMTKLHTIQQRLETLFGFPPIAAGDPEIKQSREARLSITTIYTAALNLLAF